MRNFCFALLVTVFWVSPIFGAEQIQYKEKEAVKFSGTGSMTTRPFRVSGEWELQWEADSVFTVNLYKKGENETFKLSFVSVDDGGSGQSYSPMAGEFYLGITALGLWSATIVELNQ